jgi:hypothetical protein
LLSSDPQILRSSDPQMPSSAEVQALADSLTAHDL